jgi:hypothetical protein
MATVIKIKSASNANEPAADVLAQAEQAYSYQSNKLFIGKTESDGSGGTQVNPIVIGGQHFTDMLDHAAGTTTDSSALIVDGDSRLDELTIGTAAANLKYHDADIAAQSTEDNLSITLTPKGTGVVNVPSGYKDRAGLGNNSLVTKEYVDGATSSLSASLTISDGTTSDVVTVGTDTLSFTGGTGIDTTVSDNQVSFAIDSTVVTTSDTALTIGSTAVSVGGTITDFVALTSVVVDNLTIDGSSITAAAGDNSVNLVPTGSGTVDVASKRITNVATPTGTNDAANKGYVDAVKQALDIKDSVRAASTENITIADDLNVGDTIDGVTLADGDRVLLKNQTDASENGIYLAGATPARSPDAGITGEVTPGMFVFVEEGTANADNGYVVTTNGTITLGTTDIAFAQFSGAGQITAGDGLTKSGNTINAVGTANRISVAADAIDIATTYVGQNTITTLGTITTGVWNGTTVGVEHGGTGLATVTSNGVVLGNGTSALSATAASTADGSILQADSAGTPAFSNVIDGGSFDT